MKVAGREFTVVIEKGKDGYYVGSVPDLPRCHSQAKSIDVLMKRMAEVIELCLIESKEPLPEPTDFIGVQRVQVKLPHGRPSPA